MKKTISFLIALLWFAVTFSQSGKPTYNPCLLSDSVETRLDFIRLNAVRIFSDTADCKQHLFDSIATSYVRTRNKKFLDVLSYLRTSSASNKVEDLYTDVIRKFVQTDFSDFLLQLYNARGKYLALENELAITMNMIIDGRPYKQKYLGLLNVEISKAKDAKNTGYATYLEKLKLKIEEDRH